MYVSGFVIDDFVNFWSVLGCDGNCFVFNAAGLVFGTCDGHAGKLLFDSTSGDNDMSAMIPLSETIIE